MEKQKIKELPQNDRPYERCVRLGPEGLTDEELLAIIIRTGSKRMNSLETARCILSLHPAKKGILGLCHLTLSQLKKVPGVGTVKGIQLLCIGELSRRISRQNAVEHTETFRDPLAVANYYMEELRHKEQEYLYAMFLDNKSRLTKDVLISKGTVNASLASPREIYIEALKHQAVGLILVHNHPSGDPMPSKEDHLLTRRVREAGTLIDIKLLDHVVIGDGCYCSFQKEGML